jgi:probable rRNA maturation factor
MDAAGPLSIDIAVQLEAWHRVGDLEALADRAVRAALAVADLHPAGDASLSLVLCDDPFIRTLNRQWRDRDCPTNVLSFPAAEPMRAMTVGDVIVAFETSAREASEHGMALADYLQHLIIHGVLHLFGFDHERAADAAVMEALEARVLASLGIVSPYDDPEPYPLPIEAAT